MSTKTDPFTVVYPSDGGACGMYRMILPGEACKNVGKPVMVVPRPPQIAVDNEGKIREISTGNAEIVIFQRPATAQMAPAIKMLQAKGVVVVIDMDDSLSLIDPRNTVHKSYDPRLSHNMNWMHAAKACEMADWITVTTPALAEEYGAHGRVSIIPNYVPTKYLSITRPENEVPVVTWAGFTGTHPGDLTQTAGMINQALVETGAAFMALGDLNIFQELKVRYRAPNFHVPFSGFQDYPRSLARADIGLVPLRNTPFNKGKSCLKALEYSSLGIVPVVSPTPDNMRFVELGGALVAEKPSDWHTIVKDLILDTDKRNELSAQVRKVAADCTVESNWELWWDAWCHASDRRHQ